MILPIVGTFQGCIYNVYRYTLGFYFEFLFSSFVQKSVKVVDDVDI